MRLDKVAAVRLALFHDAGVAGFLLRQGWPPKGVQHSTVSIRVAHTHMTLASFFAARTLVSGQLQHGLGFLAAGAAAAGAGAGAGTATAASLCTVVVMVRLGWTVRHRASDAGVFAC